MSSAKINKKDCYSLKVQFANDNSRKNSFQEQSLIAGLRAMNEPVVHTLKPLEEEESEDERADEVFANTQNGSSFEQGLQQQASFTSGDEANQLQTKVPFL